MYNLQGKTIQYINLITNALTTRYIYKHTIINPKIQTKLIE